MNSILYKDKNEGRNLKSEKSQDYSQKPQRNCTFNEFHLCIKGQSHDFFYYQFFHKSYPPLSLLPVIVCCEYVYKKLDLRR
jgi:hypothetical protein